MRVDQHFNNLSIHSTRTLVRCDGDVVVVEAAARDLHLERGRGRGEGGGREGDGGRERVS